MDGAARTCNVVIVGAGFGGLATANLLAQAGKRVVLVESRRKLGGLLRSFKREGVSCPVGVHYFGAAGQGELLGQVLSILGVRDALALRRVGTAGIIDRYVFDDFSFDLPSSVDAFAASVRVRFPESPAAVDFVIDALQKTVDGLAIDAEGRVAPTALGGFVFGETAEEALRSHGCPEGLIRIMGVQAFWSGSELRDMPLASPLMFLGTLLKSAWELGCTGAEMADALGRRAGNLGVEIATADPVAQVLVDDGRACGVRLQSGAEIRADHVVGAIHPKTLVGMVPGDALPQSYRDAIMALEETPGSFGVVALVDAARHQPLDYNAFRIRRVAGGGGEGVFVQIRPSNAPGMHRLVLLTFSDYDDWARWEGTRLRHRGSDYEEKKHALALRLLDDARDVVGPIQDPKILDVWTPLTLRDYTGTVRGGIYGVRHGLSDGIERMVLTRLGLPGLFLVGQNAIAPGLFGVALSALRVAGDIVGRAQFRQLLAERVGAGA